MITSMRFHFIGFHVTKQVRDALRRRAKDHGISVSLLLYRIVLDHFNMKDEIEEMLRERNAS